MTELVHNLTTFAAQAAPDKIALTHKGLHLTYQAIAQEAERAAKGLHSLGISAGDRIGIYLPKQPETVISFFATNQAGAAFVPINPLLKPAQVKHILNDCGIRILITSKERYNSLSSQLRECRELHTIVLVNDTGDTQTNDHNIPIVYWSQLLDCSDKTPANQAIDTDIATILYTSGSTGSPKGVVLSHRNLISGIRSVSSYLDIQTNDKLLAVLPFSFDYGLNQLTTAFYKTASVVLMDYLLPSDVIKTVCNEGITGLAGVPPLWNQIAHLNWPKEAKQSLRYITSSGGAMPKSTLDNLRGALPDTKLYLMYGLTEAFRSTYLPPDQLDKRPDSIGKAIPNVRISVVREDGSQCAPGETGELVHHGSLVAMGYWNDPAKTAERFKPAPAPNKALSMEEIAVWSGDYVKMDEEGYLYFIGRHDEMIKTSGFRVSPTEVEEVLYSSGLIHEAVALGIPHPTLGQGIIAVISTHTTEKLDDNQLLNHCKKELPNFMVPQVIKELEFLPRTPNGKIDRKQLHTQFQDVFN